MGMRALIGDLDMSHSNSSQADPTANDALTGDTPEPAFQSILPNLDKMSRDSFKEGTVSRRRIVFAAGFLAAILILISGAVLFTVLF